MDKEQLPSIKNEAEKSLGKEKTQQLTEYYDSVVDKNSSTATEDFVKRAQENYTNTLGNKPYSDYVNDVQKNIGTIRDKSINTSDSTLNPKK